MRAGLREHGRESPATCGHRQKEGNTKGTVKQAPSDTLNNFPACSPQALCVIDIIRSMRGLSTSVSFSLFSSTFGINWHDGRNAWSVCVWHGTNLPAYWHTWKAFALNSPFPSFPVCLGDKAHTYQSHREGGLILSCKFFLCLPKYIHMVDLLKPGSLWRGHSVPFKPSFGNVPLQVSWSGVLTKNLFRFLTRWFSFCSLFW